MKNKWFTRRTGYSEPVCNDCRLFYLGQKGYCTVPYNSPLCFCLFEPRRQEEDADYVDALATLNREFPNVI